MLIKISSLVNLLRAVVVPDTWKTLDRCDVLLVRADGDCGYTYHGKAYSQMIDSIGDLFVNHNLVTRSVATPYCQFTGIRAYNFPVSYNRSGLFIALFRRVLHLLGGPAFSLEWANKRRLNLWERILEKSKPQCVIGIQPDEGLCRASKIRGVPVYDLQHGVINDQNHWYNEEHRVGTAARDLPDGFLCWDESSAATLRKWAPQKGIDVRVVGNIWFLRFLFPKASDPLVQEAESSNKIFSNNRPVILVSLQWGMDMFYKSAGFNKVMVDSLEKTILETADSYNWLLRLHPVQIRGAEKSIANRYLMNTFGHLHSVDWRKCSELPLPVVLKQVDLHITDLSTVVVEAAWMGVYSALLNDNICPGGSMENIYSHERDLGMAEVLLQDTKIIKHWIANTIVKGRRESTLQDTTNALQGFIDDIVKKNKNASK